MGSPAAVIYMLEAPTRIADLTGHEAGVKVEETTGLLWVTDFTHGTKVGRDTNTLKAQRSRVHFMAILTHGKGTL